MTRHKEESSSIDFNGEVRGRKCAVINLEGTGGRQLKGKRAENLKTGFVNLGGNGAGTSVDNHRGAVNVRAHGGVVDRRGKRGTCRTTHFTGRRRPQK